MNEEIRACDAFERALARYADGETRDAAERRRVEEHVRGCDACWAALEDLRAASALLQDAFAASPLAATLAEKVREGVREQLGSSYTVQVREAVAAVSAREPRIALARASALEPARGGRLLRWLAPVAACCALFFSLRMIDREPALEPVARVDASHLTQRIGLWPARESGAAATLRCPEGAAHAAAPASTLHAGDVFYNTGLVGTFVELDDGSRLAVGPGAGLRFAAADRIELLASPAAAGAETPMVFCEVTRRGRRQRSFEVRAGTTVVTVLGTRFTVAGLQTTRVSVLEGRVRVASPLESRVLAVEEGARVDEDEGAVHEIPVDLGGAVGWVPGYGNYRPEHAPVESPPAGLLPGRPPARVPPVAGDPDVDMPVQPPKRD